VLIPPLPAAVVGVALALSFGGVNVGNTLWHTVLQTNVPEDALSRVSSYDWLISLVFMPLGFLLAGPVAGGIGLDTTLLLAAVVSAGANVAVLVLPSVRHMPQPAAVLEPAPA
jgi:hypothetical protein